MEEKTVYSYEKDNIFSGNVILDDSDKSPSGAWNIPGGCTEVKPPEKAEGFVPVWDGEKWNSVEDHRGVTYWLPGETHGSPGHVIETVGALPEGATTTEPEQSIDEMKNDKLIEVNNWTANKITGGFTSNVTGESVKYDSDTDTQLTLQGIALNSSASSISETYSSGIPVRGYPEGSTEKKIYYLSSSEIIGLCADLSAHIMKCKQEGWGKQGQVKSAQSKEELMSITLP